VSRHVTIAIGTNVVLEDNQVWPDKNVPKNFTAEDVKKEMENYGGKLHTLHEWSLLRDLTVTVVVDGRIVKVWDQ
jgi:hypothetical protein